jgi:hypothetical protein
MPKNLGEIAPTPAEDIEITSMGIALQALLNRQSQALHAAAHVRVPSGDPDPAPLGIGIIVGSEHREPAPTPQRRHSRQR